MEISWLAVIVAAVLKFAIGAGWYSPALFGTTWQKLIGRTAAEVQADMMPALIAEAVFDLIMAYILARFAAYYGAVNVFDGIVVGFMAWIGFAAPIFAGHLFYEKKPQQLVAINAGYMLVSLLVMGAVVGFWHG